MKIIYSALSSFPQGCYFKPMVAGSADVNTFTMEKLTAHHGRLMLMLMAAGSAAVNTFTTEQLTSWQLYV
jgi:hypothetical protein